MTYEERTKFVSMTPLPAGWRAVYYYVPPGRDAETMTADELLYTRSVAAIETVATWSAPLGWRAHDDDEPSPWSYDLDHQHRPVIDEEGDFVSCSNPGRIALLGPDEEINDDIRDAAIYEWKQRVRREHERRLPAGGGSL